MSNLVVKKWKAEWPSQLLELKYDNAIECFSKEMSTYITSA